MEIKPPANRVDATPTSIGCQQCHRLADELRQALKRIQELEKKVDKTNEAQK